MCVFCFLVSCSWWKTCPKGRERVRKPKIEQYLKGVYIDLCRSYLYLNQKHKIMTKDQMFDCCHRGWFAFVIFSFYLFFSISSLMRTFFLWKSWWFQQNKRFETKMELYGITASNPHNTHRQAAKERIVPLLQWLYNNNYSTKLMI